MSVTTIRYEIATTGGTRITAPELDGKTILTVQRQEDFLIPSTNPGGNDASLLWEWVQADLELAVGTPLTSGEVIAVLCTY